MSTSPIMDDRNQVAETFASKKGEVKFCPMCRNATLPPSMRLHCKWCLGSGYVAICLPCKGTGIINGIAAWDGKSQHGSTCDTCGGLKFIPSRLSEFEAWAKAHPPLVATEAKEAKVEKGKEEKVAPPSVTPPVVPPPPSVAGAVGANVVGGADSK